MKVPVEWLADYVAIEMPTEELARRLTMIGLKIENIERPAAGWDDIYVGEVQSIEPHPSSRNPLHVALVTIGDRQTTVVTGAQNVHQGDRVPIVMVGGTLPHGPDGTPLRIEPRRMAGITSQGMLCSERELGLSEEHEGIFILPPDAPVGRPLREIMGGDVLDIETNPNRPDTLSIIGIAREVAAMTRQQVQLPDLDVLSERVTPTDVESIAIEIEAPEGCRRFSALRIDGVRIAPSPGWLAARLEAAGMRSINLLVDLTNYVMLEYGQPMHAYDAEQLKGNRIIVRAARDGETLRTLDGVERQLTPDDLVIADGERAIGIAGVMGAENTEISEATTSIVLEAANFDPVSVRRTAKRLGLRTEASARFEKGLPPEQTVLGIKRFLQLLDQILESSLSVARLSDVHSALPDDRVVTMPIRDVHRLIGLQIPVDDAAEALSLLGFGVTVRDSVVEATVPYWRRADIDESADLVEEVGRLVGFDRIPSTLPRHTLPPEPLPSGLHWEREVRERLLAAGINESLTHSLTSPESMARLLPPADQPSGELDPALWASLVPNPAGVAAHQAELRPVTLLNPATRDRQMLRLSLLPSLIDAVSRNLRETDERLQFFEIDRIAFRRVDDLAYERRILGLALSGVRQPRTWRRPGDDPVDFYDLRGVIEAIVDTLHVSGVTFTPSPHPALHPGRSARVRRGGEELGFLGELHPLVAAGFGIDTWPVLVAELDLDSLFDLPGEDRSFHPLPRYPAAYRDIAVVIDADTPAERVLDVVRRHGGDLLESTRIFDVYSGQPLAEGARSIAIGLAFRAPGATLTQDEVNAVMAKIVNALQQELHATLRE